MKKLKIIITTIALSCSTFSFAVDLSNPSLQIGNQLGVHAHNLDMKLVSINEYKEKVMSEDISPQAKNFLETAQLGGALSWWRHIKTPNLEGYSVIQSGKVIATIITNGH